MVCATHHSFVNQGFEFGFLNLYHHEYPPKFSASSVAKPKEDYHSTADVGVERLHAPLPKVTITPARKNGKCSSGQDEIYVKFHPGRDKIKAR
jgi:hypothetical protein